MSAGAAYGSPTTPTQRGRASMEVLGAVLRQSSGPLRNRAQTKFEASAEGERLAGAMAQAADRTAVEASLAQAKALALSDPTYRLERFLQRYVAEQMMPRDVLLAEERRGAHEAVIAATSPAEGSATLELDPSLPVPDYYRDVHYHLAPHRNADYDLAWRGGGIGMVFQYGGFAAVPLDSGFATHRIETARQFPKTSYGRILEMGCGGLMTLAALHAVHPEAELVGCDLNAVALEGGWRAANKMGVKVAFKQRDARATGEPDESFDAILTFALHHEAPVADNLAMFREMFRLLTPGGDVVINDPPPFRAVAPFHAVLLDWDTDNREEPYFTETCLADWDAALREVGFVDVSSYPLNDGPGRYPWITRATKPG